MKLVLPRRAALFAFGSLALLSGAIVAMRALSIDRTERSLADLSLVTSLKSSSALEEMEEARSDVVLWSGFGGLIRRFADLEAAWIAMGPNAAAILERNYVVENPFSEAERSRLTDAGDGSDYSSIHAEFQPLVREFLEIHGYHDVLLLNPSGRVVYSFRKAADFGANLLGGPWQETHLAQVARTAPSLGPGIAVIADFQPYGPRGEEWALFLGAAVHGVGSGAEQGALVLELSPEHIGRHLVREDQQLESAKSTILGDGYRLLGRPPWIEGVESGNPVEMEALARARGADTGEMVVRGRDGSDVLAAWEAVSFQGIRWVVVSQAALDEVRAEGAAERQAVVVAAALLWLALGVLTLGGQRTSALGRHSI